MCGFCAMRHRGSLAPVHGIVDGFGVSAQYLGIQTAVDAGSMWVICEAPGIYLQHIGDGLSSANRQGLVGSAARYVDVLLAATSGHRLGMPIVAALPVCGGGGGHRDRLSEALGVEEFHVRFCSQCEHHLLPFYGTAHLAYLPGPDGRRLTSEQLQSLIVMYSRWARRFRV
jgi:GTP cyclohydrolase I